MPPIPWRQIVTSALIGTIAVVAVVLIDVDRRGGNPVALVEPGERGPSVEAFHEDFPDLELPGGLGHDGQQFYAIARAPMHLDAAAAHLDRPHYRLQRPVYPWLAWLLHPTGGGLGLVRVMFVVGVVALFAGAIATGALSSTFGGPAWLAGVFPILPGSYVSLRISVADALALALCTTAIVLSIRDRHRWATVAAVAAVLTKEPLLLVLSGFALWRRDRRGLLLVAAPGIAALLWAVFLRLMVEGSGTQVREFTWPFGGFLDAWQSRWGDSDDFWALGAVAAAVLLGAGAILRYGVDTPLGWPIALHLAMLPFLSVDVVGLDLNGTRALLPVHLFAVVTLAARRAPTVSSSRTHRPEVRSSPP